MLNSLYGFFERSQSRKNIRITQHSVVCLSMVSTIGTYNLWYVQLVQLVVVCTTNCTTQLDGWHWPEVRMGDVSAGGGGRARHKGHKWSGSAKKV